VGHDVEDGGYGHGSTEQHIACRRRRSGRVVAQPPVGAARATADGESSAQPVREVEGGRARFAPPRRRPRRGALARSLQIGDAMDTASDLMTRAPVCLPAHATVRQALAALFELDARHLPIVDEDRQVIGMVSDRDLRSREGGLDDKLSTLMSTDVLTVGAEASVADVVERMVEFRVGALPVIDPEGALVGIVSYIDVLRAMARTLAEE
jgi:acetoin utilization protein AcuB